MIHRELRSLRDFAPQGGAADLILGSAKISPLSSSLWITPIIYHFLPTRFAEDPKKIMNHNPFINC